MTSDAISLLDRLIATPSVSRDESRTADLIEAYISSCGKIVHRIYNNVYALSASFDPAKPTLLLNSHHDTVKPVSSYTMDPFKPVHRDGRIYGLGSNDAGASVVSMIEAFMALDGQTLPVNLIIAVTAEEEVSGANGVSALLPQLHKDGISIDMALVGEPTGMQPAIAERGLVVIDCTARGISGHAARDEGVNALYRALDDIAILRSVKFDRVSPVLGDIKVTVTQINAGSQHNVVPYRCDFVADIRTTDAYTNAEIVEMLSRQLASDVKARSTRLHASVIDGDHPLVRSAVALGGTPFVSPTMSDRALMHGIPALKMGPGQSSRSHSADEFVLESEIADAIVKYQQLILSL